MTERLCIIPARGGSKRLPGKNKKVFHNGNPIIHYPIKAAMACGIFTEVMVSSDDSEILDYAHHMGAHAVHRHEELCGDGVPETMVYEDILKSFYTPPEYFCAVYPCAAFLNKADFLMSFDRMEKTFSDACMGVTKFDLHPWQAIMQKPDGNYILYSPHLNDEPEYPPAYASNGSLYWFRTESFLKNPTYFPEKLQVQEVFNIDINTQEDFERAQRKYARIQ